MLGALIMNHFIYMTSRLAFILALTWGVGALLHAMGNPLLMVWVLVGLPISLKVLFMIEERFSL
jgi:hypothetical protein